MIRSTLALIRREPVRAGALAQAIIIAASVMWLHLDEEALGAVAAVIAAATALVVRGQVTPTVSIEQT